MSAYLMGRVFYTDLPAHLKLTLLALADVADDDGHRVMLGQARIARKAGCDERTVRRHLDRLRELGLIEKIGRVGSRGQDRHRIIVEALPTAEQIALEFARPDRMTDRTPVTDRTPSVASTGHPASPDRTPVTADSSENPSGDSSVAASRPRRAPDPLWDELEALYGPPAHDADRGRRNRAVKLLRQAGADAVEVHALHAYAASSAEAWVRNTVATPIALATNVGDLRRGLTEGTTEAIRRRLEVEHR